MKMFDVENKTENSYGNISELLMKFSCQQEQTILEDAYFTAPFKIMQPFSIGCMLHFMILSASAGLMAGDCQNIKVSLAKKSSVLLTSQSYEKIHKMNSGKACRNTEVFLAEESSLFFLPQPVLPFAQSSFSGHTIIHLKDVSSQLFFSEILACGRSVRQERFSYRKYASCMEIYQAEELCYFENASYDPERRNMEGFGFYEGYTHLATVLLFNFGNQVETMSYIRQKLAVAENIDGGVSKIGEGHFCMKAFGHSGEELLQFVKDLQGFIFNKKNKSTLTNAYSP